MAYTASKVIEIALNEVGYLEKKSNSNLDSKTGNAGYNNWTKYARDLDAIPNFYNGKKNGYAWCDMFVDWVFVKAFGVDIAKKLLCQPNKSYGAGCYYSARYYKNNGQFHTKNPKKGDQIFFWNSSKSDVAHTGLVYKVDNTYVYTVEGNTSSASGVVANGGAVEKKKYSLSYSRIYGYGRPKYDSEPEGSVVPNNDNDGKIEIVKKGQEHAVKFTGVKIDIDGIVGKDTNKMKSRVLQHAMNLDYKDDKFGNITEDGIFGTKSKNKLGSHYVEKGEEQYMVTAAEILLMLHGIDPNGVEYPGEYGNGMVKAAKKFFGDNGTKITASEFLKLIK